MSSESAPPDVPSTPEPATAHVGTAKDPAIVLPRPFGGVERYAVIVLSLIHACVFAWALVLPWDSFTFFAVFCCVVGAAHLATAVISALPRLRPILPLTAWRVSSLLSLTFLVWASWAIFSSAWYLSGLYAGLGRGFSAALLAIWGLVVLVTLPFSVWGLVRSRGCCPRLPRKAMVLALMAIGLPGARDHSAVSVPRGDSREWSSLLGVYVVPVVRALPPSKSGGTFRSEPLARRPFVCDGSGETALVLFRTSRGALTQLCLGGKTAEELAQKIGAELHARASKGEVLIDRLTATRWVTSTNPLLDPLKLRPGLDGACLGQRCYAPWQLVGQHAFVSHAPVAFLEDLKLGISLTELRKNLGGMRSEASGKPLLAITTQSTSLTPDGRIQALSRLHPVAMPVTRETVTSAKQRYESHIIAAQQPDGKFRYLLDPFTGQSDLRNFSLPRQAGTLLALCELGSQNLEVTEAVRRGLGLLLRHQYEAGTRRALALQKKGSTMELGDSALPLVALLSCRTRVGAEFDESIVGLARFVLHLQRPDGSFATKYDWKKQRSRQSAEALYAPGQALLGLTLLDALLRDPKGLPLSVELGISQKELGEAIQLGMNQVAEEHWAMAMKPFFFIEENWNCLTARAALRFQRNPAYERFCFDYVKFKRRLILDARDGVAPEFFGGFGFGNLIPPHNTGAAGFGEALAAAIAVKRASGIPTAEDEATLASVLGFLLRQQWSPATCIGCVPEALGAMSEGMHCPIVRIDYVQHAWAAVGHGSEVLGLVGSREAAQ